MQLVRALANPTRIRILSAVAEGPCSARQLAERLDEKPGVVGYHLKVLRVTGCLRLADPERIAAPGEQAYELAPGVTPMQLVRRESAHSGPGHPPAAVVRTVLEKGKSHRGEDLFGMRRDQLSCASMVVDRQGWRDISAAIGEALDRISTAHRESTRRLTESEEEGISATVAVASFESSEGRAR
jgi:DNA-binding transcriptional ArsR family regulator